MEKNKSIECIIEKKSGSEYDVAVMYSGGKDSAFLIYLFREIYKLRVVAVFVDNGYEFSSCYDRMKSFVDNIGVPLVIVKPEKSYYTSLFHALITDPKDLKGEKKNHVCHTCNNILWLFAVEYASNNDIPYVASGLSYAQLTVGRERELPDNQMANAIACKTTKYVSQRIFDYFEKCDCLNKDAAFMNKSKQLIENIGKVETIYPYIYHTVSIEEQKKLLMQYGQWNPPVEVSHEKYISSGCLVMSRIIGEMEKLELLKMTEREEAKKMFDQGLIEREKIDYAFRDVTKEKVDLSDIIFQELGIYDYLYNVAKERNQL